MTGALGGQTHRLAILFAHFLALVICIVQKWSLVGLFAVRGRDYHGKGDLYAKSQHSMGRLGALFTLLLCKRHQLRLEIDKPCQECLSHQLEVALLRAVVNARRRRISVLPKQLSASIRVLTPYLSVLLP